MAGVVALAVYLLAASYHERPLEKRVWARTEHLLNIVSLAIVFGLLAFLSCALVFFIISIAFRGATVDMWAASVLLALSLGVASYGTYLMAVGMNAMRVSAILALFLVSGTFISMMTASDPLWWDVHFSSLGAGGGVSGYAFNASRTDAAHMSTVAPLNAILIMKNTSAHERNANKPNTIASETILSRCSVRAHTRFSSGRS
jgi:hypothetical protein